MPGRGWVDELREYTPPQPYWPARRAPSAEQSVRVVAAGPHRFADLVEHLHANGYLARDFAQPYASWEGRDSVISELALALEQ